MKRVQQRALAKFSAAAAAVSSAFLREHKRERQLQNGMPLIDDLRVALAGAGMQHAANLLHSESRLPLGVTYFDAIKSWSPPFRPEPLVKSHRSKYADPLAGVADASDVSLDVHGVVNGSAAIAAATEHVVGALSLPHPFSGRPTFPAALAAPISAYDSWDASGLEAFRVAQIARWQLRAAALKGERLRWLAQLPPHVASVLQRFHLPFFREMLEAAGGIDTSLVNDIEKGFSLLGILRRSGRWPKADLPTTPPPADSLYASAAERLDAILEERCRRPDPEWRTIADRNDAMIASGKYEMSSLSALRKHIHSGLPTIIAPQFGERQWDLAKDGKRIMRKVRPCDDDRFGGANDHVASQCRLVLPEPDAPLSQAVEWHDRLPRNKWRRLNIWLKDEESAYTNWAAAEGDHRFLILPCGGPGGSAELLATGVWVRVVRFFCLGFGATGGVYGYNRVRGGITDCARALLLVPVTAYYDDSWDVEPEDSIQSASWAFEQLHMMLGVPLKGAPKDLPPAPERACLGYIANVALWPPERRNKPERSRHLRAQCSRAVDDNSLPPSEAGSLAGKLGFWARGSFGAVARCPCAPLYARQHELATRGRRRYQLTPSVLAALLWIVEVLTWAPPRAWPFTFFEADAYPTLWTDACGENPTGGCGAFLARPLPGGSWQFIATSFVWPESALHCFRDRKQWISVFELGAALAARWIFSSILEGAPFRHFVDNDGAGSQLWKGFTNVADLNALAGAYWALSVLDGALAWISRVPSARNPADRLSHGLWDFAATLSAKHVSVNHDPFFEYIVATVRSGVPKESATIALLGARPNVLLSEVRTQ